MENYIVRIYRRERRNPGRLVGVLEVVGIEGRQAFTTVEELWMLLTFPGARMRNRGSEKDATKHRRI